MVYNDIDALYFFRRIVVVISEPLLSVVRILFLHPGEGRSLRKVVLLRASEEGRAPSSI